MPRPPKVLRYIGDLETKIESDPLENLITAFHAFIDSENKRRVATLTDLQDAPEEYVKASEIAKHIKCAETTVINLAEAGKIPFIWWKEGSKTSRRFKLSEVVKALETGGTKNRC